MPDLRSDRLDHTRDRSDYSFKLRHLESQLFAPCCGQLVVASAAVSSRRAPLRGHPSLDKHSLQRGIQRAFFHLKNVFRYPLNRIGDLVPVHLAGARERSQDQKIERSRRNFVSIQIITRGIVRLWQCRTVSRLCQGSRDWTVFRSRYRRVPLRSALSKCNRALWISGWWAR